MDKETVTELKNIKNSIKLIISELDSISAGITTDFYGIEEKQVGKCIDRVVENYRSVKKRLDNIDTSS